MDLVVYYSTRFVVFFDFGAAAFFRQKELLMLV